MSSKIECILDASAVLAFLQREAGRERVHQALGKAGICAVNYSEVMLKLVRAGATAEQAEQALSSLRILIVSFDQAHAAAAACLHSRTSVKGLSLGDRACLAAAQLLSVPALTANRNWRIPGLGIDVEFIR